MSVGTVDIYLDAGHPPAASLNNNGPGLPFAVLELCEAPGRAYIALRTAAEADALILAAVAAKDLLLAAQEPEPPAGDMPDSALLPAADYIRDVAGDLDAIPPHRIGEPAPLPGGAS